MRVAGKLFQAIVFLQLKEMIAIRDRNFDIIN